MPTEGDFSGYKYSIALKTSVAKARLSCQMEEGMANTSNTFSSSSLFKEDVE